MSRRAKNRTGESSSSKPESKASASDVSRETTPTAVAPDSPPSAEQVFGERLPVVRRYAELLAGPGTERGLLGPREVPRLWDRHLLNCGVLAGMVPMNATVCDIGSGAGLPGIVLAITRPDLRITLLEPLLRRAAFLSEVAEELDLAGVTVVRERAEDHRGSYDVVTARAVAPLSRLARVALGLCRPGGSVLAMKGDRAGTELEEARPELDAAGAAEYSIERLGADLLSVPTTVVRVVAGTARGGASSAKQRRNRRDGSGSARGV
ncbi:16S rRNA (guanine527-N7)-methyltransferase [Actinopolymorpha cephalotaxi]|uniref:Ribosomal RNA small subunit methyltransferase G n=1 Tax=Actinopolymorpha cephalotaxi TaxID=504797 RepID=A0A1I2UG24_9ACTN|nr:16S rRNA (guanine527-N7)-methyltransferase [Actinopolymorpha cephalotaxi]